MHVLLNCRTIGTVYASARVYLVKKNVPMSQRKLVMHDLVQIEHKHKFKWAN